MAQMVLSTKQKQIMAKESRLVVARVEEGENGMDGEFGVFGCKLFHYKICNGKAMGPCTTTQGTVCDWVTLLCNRN